MMISWVILHGAIRHFTPGEVRSELSQIYPGHFGANDERSFVIDGPTPGQLLIQSTVPAAGGTFLMMNVSAPYAEFSPFLDTIKDQSLRELARSQCCWVSIDLIARHASDDDAYRFIGRALSGLAPRDSAVLVHPERFVVVPFTDEVRKNLANGVLP